MEDGRLDLSIICHLYRKGAITAGQVDTDWGSSLLHPDIVCALLLLSLGL